MAVKDQVEVEGTLFLFDSQEQGELYVQVRDRLGENDSELFSKWGHKPGWWVLNKLIARQREEQLKEMGLRPPSEMQVRKLTLYRQASVDQNRPGITRQIDNVLESFEASMATFSRALDVCGRNLELPPVEEALGRLGETGVDEEPF